MSAPTTPAQPSDLSPVDELAVVRGQVASARRQVDAGVWVVIVLGLAFTAVNVQHFAAGDALAWSPPWAVAWLLDPMVSVLLLSIVRAEQVTARWQVSMGWQVTTSKWGCFAATYVMNTWSSWRAEVPSGVVLHSVPPVAVLLAAEAAPIVRDRLTAAAAAAAAAHQPHTSWGNAPGPVAPPVAPASPVVLLEAPSVPAATGTPWSEGSRREGPDIVIPPAGDDPGPSQGPAPDPEPAPPAGPASGPGPGDTTPPPPSDGEHDQAPDREATPAGPASGPGPGDTTPPPPSDGEHDQAPDREATLVAAPAPVTGEGRLQLLVELLDAGHEVTGPHAAALLTHLGESTSERTGRRLLLAARKVREAREDDSRAAPEDGASVDEVSVDEISVEEAPAEVAGTIPTGTCEQVSVEARTGTDDRPDTTDGFSHRGPGLVLLPSRDLADGGRR